jgi:exodeoxyribonuclease V beta subunit
MNLPRLQPTTVALRSVTLIEASAGTGKTFTITTLFVRLVLEGVEVRKILVVTYTNAATAELRDRVRRRLREALDAFGGAPPADATLAELLASRAATRSRDLRLLVQALRSFDEAAIFTIHGFCQRMLQDHAFESGVAFDAELVGEQDLLRDEVVRDFWARYVAPAERWFVEFLDHDSIDFLRLSKLARKVAEDPRLVVVPADAGDADPSLGAWKKAASAASRIWKTKRDEVLALLEKSKVGLYKNPFESPRERFAPSLDIELGSPRPWISKRSPDLRHLSPEGMKLKTKSGWQTPKHPFFDACGDLVREEQALEAVVRPRALRLELELVEYVRREIRERKQEANVQSFDDLLNRLDDALEATPELGAKIREKFPAALIDEFQDTDPTQYGIFRKMYLGPPATVETAGESPSAGSGVSFFLIGDPKQAIYSFRGADVFTYMAARKDARGEFTLDTNWRSDPRLIAAVNALFARAPQPFVFDDIPFVAVAPREGAVDCLGGTAAGAAPLEILVAAGSDITKSAGEENLPLAVAAEIARFLQSGATLWREGRNTPIAPGDVAVLCRTNAQAKATHAALSRLGVPAVLYGDANVFDADEAVEVERVLRAMAEPGDQATLRAALVTTLVGLDGEELDRLRDDESGWDEVVLEFATLSELWRTKGFVAAFRRMLERYGVEARLLRWVDGERRLTNVLHLGELLQNAAASEHRGPLALVEWLGNMRSDKKARGELGAEAAQIRLESDALRVKLTTVHQAKGLEYPIVYCPFLWTKFWEPAAEGFAFHDPDAGNERRLDIGSPERPAHAQLYVREELAESLRLLYVALTRAKHRCSVVWGAFRDGGSSALGYLLHRAPLSVSDGGVQGTIHYVASRLAAQAKLDEDLRQIAEAANGAIVVRELPAFEPTAYSGAPEVAEITAPRRSERALDDGWRTSSFTRLASGHGRISAVAEEGIDHDETDEADAEGRESDGRELREATIALHDFPRGARAGEVLHEVLETIDFAAAPSAIAERAAMALAGHGLDAVSWRLRLTDAIAAVLATPLGGAAGSLTIRDVAAERRLSEMEFLFPVGEQRGRLTGNRLAAVLRKHGAPAARASYADRVEHLGFTPLAGFLRGFVDLVFEHDGRWYLVDWKSNFLGAVASAYSPSRIAAAMETHHYFLQYQLYLVALHRHLGLRLRGYDPERHLGGVYYLFLRGMAPGHPPGTGIFHDRPPTVLVEDLSKILHGAARSS